MQKFCFSIGLALAIVGLSTLPARAETPPLAPSELAGCYVRAADDSQAQSTIVLSLHASSPNDLRMTATCVRQAELLASPECSIIANLHFDKSSSSLMKESGERWAKVATKDGKWFLEIASENHFRLSDG